MSELPKPGVKVKDVGPFKILYDIINGKITGIDLIICIGGRGGRKSYGVSKAAAYGATIRSKRCVVLRDEHSKIRESILQEIFNRYDKANEHGHFDAFYDKIETGIRDRTTGDMIVFTQGFRASSKDKQSNLKGVSDVDIAIVDEAEDIRSKSKFSTFKDSLRKPGRLIIVMLNTPDVDHWIIKAYFDLDPILNDDGSGSGYFKLVPKKIEGFAAIITSYKDNDFLPSNIVRDYEAYGDPNSHTYDLHYYMTQILGYASSGRKGQIFTKVKKISLADYAALPYKEIYGLDFGTARPAGLVGVKVHHNTSWCRQLNYLPKDALGIGIMLCKLGLTGKDLIIADSAGRLDIAKLRSGWSKSELTPEQIEAYPQLLKGFYILGAVKPPGSIESGISLMKSMELYAVEESTDLWHEIRNYIYAVDKYERALNEPVDDYNHLLDPWRYVVTVRGRLY
jgi:PBSX family phage terminase large subunit